MARHVRQLDMRNNLASSIADRMNVVPGFKTSAAFFTFLRANLVLPESTLHSNYSTPTISPYSSQTLPPLYTLPPSSLSITATASMPQPSTQLTPPPPNPLDDIPSLTTAMLTSDDDKIAALKLVADSIAQQRQFASKSMIFHPLVLSVYFLLLGIISKLFYNPKEGLGIVVTTCAGLTMALLVGIRGISSGYLSLAEKTGWAFLKSEGGGEEDIVLGSRYGDELIGALVLRLERNPSSPSSKKRGGGGSKSKTGGQGIIRAWTVRIKYRNNGVGTELLEEAIRVAREKLGSSAEVGFAKEHANSTMVMPDIFNGGFRKREKRAAKGLERVLGEMDGGGGKKKR